MARIRKAAKILKRPESRAAAGSAMVEADGDVFAVDARSIFGNEAPLEIELGAGKGDFIVARARKCPERNFLAVELSGVVSVMLAVRCGHAALDNLGEIRMEARRLVNLMLADRSVNTVHGY